MFSIETTCQKFLLLIPNGTVLEYHSSIFIILKTRLHSISPFHLTPKWTVLEYHSTPSALLKTRSCIQFHKNVLFIAKCFQLKQLVQNSCSYPLIKNNDDHIFFDSQLIWSRMSLTIGSQWNCYSQWNCSWISFHINCSFKDQKLHPIP